MKLLSQRKINNKELKSLINCFIASVYCQLPICPSARFLIEFQVEVASHLKVCVRVDRDCSEEAVEGGGIVNIGTILCWQDILLF